jgi:hypothetical protein
MPAPCHDWQVHVKYLIWGALLTCVPSVTLAQETAPRATAIPLDARFELVLWASLGTLRLDKSTGEVALLVDVAKYETTWELTEFKADPDGVPYGDAPRYRPSGGGAVRFQLVAGRSSSTLFLVDTTTGLTWVSFRVMKIRNDGVEYRGVEWRPLERTR